MTSPTIPVPTETVLGAFNETLEMVLKAEREHKRSEGVDYFARRFFVDHGETLSTALAASPALASPVPSDAGVMRLVEALRSIAREQKMHELSDDGSGDWAEGIDRFEDCIDLARAALSEAGL